MKNFSEYLTEKKKKKSKQLDTSIDISRLTFIKSLLNSINENEINIRNLELEDIEKFNNCLMGMQGCAGKVKEIYEKSKS